MHLSNATVIVLSGYNKQLLNDKVSKGGGVNFPSV